MWVRLYVSGGNNLKLMNGNVGSNYFCIKFKFNNITTNCILTITITITTTITITIIITIIINILIVVVLSSFISFVYYFFSSNQ